jgi:polyhydroxyalkanoate synthesis regulator phasin
MDWLAIASLVVSVVIGIIAIIKVFVFQEHRLTNVEAQAGQTEKQEGRIAKLEKQVAKIETKVDLFWNMVEKRMSDYLKSPHTPEMDKLLDKVSKGQITLSERKKLRKITLETVNNGGYNNSKNKECAAEMLIAILDARIKMAKENL